MTKKRKIYIIKKPLLSFKSPEPEIKKIMKILLRSKLSLGLICSLELSDSSCILFSTELSLKKAGFIFIGPNPLSRAEDLATVNHVAQAVVRVGSKIGS